MLNAKRDLPLPNSRNAAHLLPLDLPFEQVTKELFDETVNINMNGVFFTVQEAIPLMSKGSAMVLNSLINAHLGMPGTTVYTAARGRGERQVLDVVLYLISRFLRPR